MIPILGPLHGQGTSLVLHEIDGRMHAHVRPRRGYKLTITRTDGTIVGTWSRATGECGTVKIGFGMNTP